MLTQQEKRRLLRLLGFCLAAVFSLVYLTWRMQRSVQFPETPHLGISPNPVSTPYPDPVGIVLHDSDSPAVVNGIPINAEALERIHAKDHPNWATVFEGKTYHIGYHYVILPDGTIEKGRPDHCIGTHARKHNDWLGICVIGAFSKHRRWQPSTPTEEQVESVIALCRELMQKYHIPLERVKRHQDVNYTDCPGARFPYDRIIAALSAGDGLRQASRN
jgi:N-acetyl-anhydromuramyl-L-alanine amidase AmpD